jgi:hypothetical protein
MGKAFTFQFEGLDKALSKLKDLPDDIKEEINETIEDSAKEVVKKAKIRAPKFDGQLQQAIGYGPMQGGVGFEVFAAKNYAAFMEFGTGPKVKVPSELSAYAAQFKNSKKGTFEDMVKNIQRWLKKKGGTGERNEAVFVSLQILRNGLNPQPFFFNSYFEERIKLLQRIKNVLKLK